MDCSRFQELIHPSLDGALPEEQDAFMQRHALVCARCGARLHSLRTALTLLRETLPSEAIDPGFRERLAARALDRFVPEGPEPASAAQRPLPF
jgi:anti-sigma factor RsiW